MAENQEEVRKDEKEEEKRVNKWKLLVSVAHLEDTYVCVTPQMIVTALKRLQYKRSAVRPIDIANYLMAVFPVCCDKAKLMQEVESKLEVALQMGFVVVTGNGYRLPHLREQSYLTEAAVSAFWERYNELRLPNIRKKEPLSRPYTGKPRQARRRKKWSIDRSIGTDSSGISLKARRPHRSMKTLDMRKEF